MKIGDLVKFSYSETQKSLSLGTEPDAIGVYAGNAENGMFRVLYAGNVYELEEELVQPITAQRMAAVNEALDNIEQSLKQETTETIKSPASPQYATSRVHKTPQIM
tara:strand:+ start:192 stop:509 length:318 start_codon:yes stop_codon:yes gene_type:complete